LKKVAASGWLIQLKKVAASGWLIQFLKSCCIWLVDSVFKKLLHLVG